jgi:hypothetical protein
MSARPRLIRRFTTVLAVLVVALIALPGVANARPADDNTGPRSQIVEPVTPAPTVVRTVIREGAVHALPVVLASAAMLISIAGTGLVLVRIAPLRQQFH